MDEKDFFEKMTNLPKYLRDASGNIYTLVIQKNEWEACPNAYIAMFAKENTKSISTIKHLIRVEAPYIIDAVNKLFAQVENYRKAGNIKGKKWKEIGH